MGQKAKIDQTQSYAAIGFGQRQRRPSLFARRVPIGGMKLAFFLKQR